MNHKENGVGRFRVEFLVTNNRDRIRAEDGNSACPGPKRTD